MRTQQYFIDKIIKGDFTLKDYIDDNTTCYIKNACIEIKDIYPFSFKFRDSHYQQHEDDYLGNYMFLNANEKETDDIHHALVRKIRNQ